MELIVEDADVITMAADAELARAMLVRDGRIAAVGVPDEVRAAAGASAQVVRLDGATVVPGLIDAHCHVADIGYLAAAADCSQPSAPDIPAIQARLRAAADRTPEGSWVTGGGYVEYKLREGRHPTRDELDQAVPNRPAVVYHTSLHACVLNTAALREAGFAGQQPDPAGGAFGRDRDGRLDGVVFERPMFELFARNLRRDLARMGAAERNRLVARTSQQLASFGLTAACDADLRRDSFAAYAEADAAGALGLRIYGLVVHDQVDWLLGAGLRGRHSGRLAAEAVKIWADGGMSSRTAAIHGSYPVPPYGSGILYFERDELTEMVREFDARGFQVCMHAQGDRAIETVLDAYAAVTAPGNPLRHRIEHGGSLYAPLAARAAELGIVVATQPGFLSLLGDGFAEAFGDAGRRAVRVRVLAAGGPHGGRILRRAGHHRRSAGRDAGRGAAPDRRRPLLGPGEQLTAGDALAMYTTQAAFAARREDEIGSLEPGKLADFAVLDGNPLVVEPERITDIRVVATVVDGAPVYQSDSIFPGG